MLSSRLIAPFTQLVGQWRMLSQLRQSMARLDAVFALEHERKEKPVDLGRPKGRSAWKRALRLWLAAPRRCSKASTGASARAGCTASSGRNGCGKSTLFEADRRALCAAGRGGVLLDDADIAQFTRRDRRAGSPTCRRNACCSPARSATTSPSPIRARATTR
jgi:ABC-type protease/lipase transport system fused ATPase/permease subunit